MFTDMVGYTALGQRNEALSLALVEEQRKLIRPILSKHGGREVKTMGDAFLVEFLSALDAVRCAYDIQKATRELNIARPEERKIRIRVGIHLGDVIESEGDITGDAVNLASRIEPLAEGGGVCLTRQVYDHVQNKFELPLRSLGARSLKNLNTPIEVYKMVMPWEETSAVSSAQSDTKRIAVLPFANMSPDPTDEYLADGMTEELITSLSGVRGLTVVARASVMRYKASPKGASEIGGELNAGTLIEGSVRKAGNRVRITVQLIDAGNEEQIWAQNYDRQLDDIFAVQSEIAERVVKELQVQLLESERRKLRAKPTDDTEAYTLYLRARYHWSSRSEEGVKTAIRYFEETINRDPEYALALVGLADCYHISALFGYTSPKYVYPKIAELAQRALKAGGASAEAHASMGEYLMHYSYDWAGAARELEQALQINPNHALAHSWRSSCYAVLGQFDNAVAEARRGEELDPFAVVSMNEVAKDYYYARKYEEAIKQFVHSLEIEPDSAYLHKGLAETYVQQSMFNEATREIERALTISSRGGLYLDSAACVYALSNDDRKSREVLAEADTVAANHFVPSYGRAAAYAALGDEAKALQLLQTAYDEHSWLIWVGVDPIFDSLRGEQAFRSLLRKMNLVSEPVPSTVSGTP
jgi:TolB-like protein/Flp pilus assembly protein TadD